MRTLTRCMRLMRNGVRWRPVVNQPHLTVTNKSVDYIKNLSRDYRSEQVVSMIFDGKLLNSIDGRLHKGKPIPRKDIEQLIIELQHSDRVQSYDAFLLIKSCGKSLIDLDCKESIQLVQEIWDTLDGFNIKLDASHYNALLDVYLEKEFEFSPKQFLSTMIEKLVEPNRETLQKLIAASCRKGDIAEVINFMVHMKNRNMSLTEENFNLLILGHGEAGDIENAVQTLEIMKKEGIEPSADTETALMCAYAKQGNIKYINDRLEQLKADKINIKEIHYMKISLTLAVNNHWEQAEEFISKMPEEIYSDVDISRLVIKIVKLGRLELAMKLLKSTTSTASDRLEARTRLILASLVKVGTDVDIMIRICEEMRKELINENAFKDTVHYYLTNGANPSPTLKIMKVWYQTGGEIHDHFFWPLMIFEGRANNIAGILKILESMINDFKVYPSLKTLRDFTIPYMIGNRKEVMDRLEPLKISVNDIVIATADRLIIERKLKNAAILMSANPINYPKDDEFIKRFAETLNAKDDFKSFVVILRLLFADTEEKSTEFTAKILRQLMIVVPDYRPSVILNLLQEFTVAGLSISKEVADEIRDYLRINVTEEIDEVITKLESGTLTEVPMTQYNPFILQMSDTTKEPISTSLVFDLRSEFAKHMDNHDYQQAVTVFIQLENTGYMSAPVYAQAIGAFCELEDLESAEKYIDIFIEKLPQARLSIPKIMQFARLLIKKDKFDEAIKFLSQQSEAEVRQNLSRSVAELVESLLETTANKENIENTFKLFDLLGSKRLIRSSTFSIGTLINTLIEKKDYSMAVEIFTRAVEQYKCCPQKIKLLRAMNEDNDMVNLKKCLMVCNDTWGEEDTNFSMALVHLDCGRYQLTRKFFATPGLYVPYHRIALFLDYLVLVENFEAIEELVKMTKHLSQHRLQMFHQLLHVYSKRNDWKRGLDLWLKMQEDEITPDRSFLSTLQKLLMVNNQKVPFICEENSQKGRLV